MAKAKPRAPSPGHSRGSRLLALWRQRAGLTLHEACGAGYLDLDQSQFCALENGRSRPGLAKAGKIQDRTGGAVPALSWLEPDCGALVDENEARAS